MTDDELQAWGELCVNATSCEYRKLATGILRLLDENRDQVELNVALTIENAQLKLKLAAALEQVEPVEVHHE